MSRDQVETFVSLPGREERKYFSPLLTDGTCFWRSVAQVPCDVAFGAFTREWDE